MKISTTVSTLFISSALLVVLQGCGGSGGTDPSPSNVAGDGGNQPNADGEQNTPEGNDAGAAVKTIIIDATAGGLGASPDDPKNKYSYFNLDSGEVVELTDVAAESSTDWHIAFKRTKPKLNGGDSGPGDVKAAVADAQEDYYATDGKPDNSVFLNATAAQEKAALDAVTSVDGLEFKADSKSPEIIGDGGEKSWFSYDPQTHSISANPDAWNIVRGAAGESFAKLHVTNIAQTERGITIEMFIQATGETAFDTNPVSFTASLGADGGAACYDFDTKSEVDCSTAAADWDIQVEVAGRDWNVWTNGGTRGDGRKGGRFGTVSADSIASYPDAASVPAFFSDSPSGVLLDRKTRWYAYSLQNNHQIWPNYRVYAIDTGTKKYKLQVLKYYNDAGSSGHITLRYSAL
ncbi:MAG TPA: hypothetical protein DD827_10500 [Gammaproteobacteria bacterium]|nr:hypothetical protein [Gammaproteobacteria bacterium]